ncbi:DUF1311 domain-containing protein [Gracilibacillus oryzae]|uniref:DUF1311 domain-containing protein n=2 Tax=Gracilibacillus oryzae TaxID=1672701 RepID=A0A7C8GT72_9BACI|nr:DUF1311 domain-containing protein [Gracilibacillus oryzae]
MLAAILLTMVACNSSDESESTQASPSQDNSQTADSSDVETEINTIETATLSEDITKEENASTKYREGKKEEYQEKLKETKKEMDELQNNPEADSTTALKEVQGNRYEVWDDMLNEIYAILEKQLPAEEMEQLREDQREWLDLREDTAKGASLDYEGGTMEQLEYVTVLANLTEDRCFELVEDYML